MTAPTGFEPSEVRRELLLTRRLLLAAFAAALAALPFLGLLLLVRTGYAPLADLDAEVAQELNAYARQRPNVVTGLEVLDQVTSPWTFRALVLLAVVLLWRRRRRRLATWAALTMAVGGLRGVLLKLLVDRARPVFDAPVSSFPGLSFPSGHALNSMLGAAILLLIALPLLGRLGRFAACALAAVAVIVTGLDRVAIGAHYVSDVLGGWALALALVIGTGTAFGGWRRDNPRAEDSSLPGRRRLSRRPPHPEVLETLGGSGDRQRHPPTKGLNSR